MICIAFDIESTGTDVVKDRIVQLSMVKFDLNSFNILEKKKTLINPLIPINKEAEKVHGISDEMVKNSPTFKQLSKSVLSFISNCDYILTHNGKKFDILMLIEEFYRCELEWIPKPVIDTYVIMSNRLPRTLAGALSFYCGKQIENAHDAEADVLATIEVLKGQKNHYENLDIIEESKYSGEDKRLSLDGRILLSDSNEAIWGFGKFKDKKLNEADLGYINWFLTSDFPNNTKNVLRSLLNK